MGHDHQVPTSLLDGVTLERRGAVVHFGIWSTYVGMKPGTSVWFDPSSVLDKNM